MVGLHEELPAQPWWQVAVRALARRPGAGRNSVAQSAHGQCGADKGEPKGAARPCWTPISGLDASPGTTTTQDNASTLWVGRDNASMTKCRPPTGFVRPEFQATPVPLQYGEMPGSFARTKKNVILLGNTCQKMQLVVLGNPSQKIPNERTARERARESLVACLLCLPWH